MEVALFTCSVDGAVLQCNPAFRILLGYGSDAPAAGIHVAYHFREDSGWKDLVGELRNRQAPDTHETEMVTCTGQPVHVSISATQTGDLITGMALDTAERDAAEERIRLQHKRLVTARNKAEEQENLKTAFLSHMSNEILNPLNALAGFSEILTRERHTPGKLAEYADRINRSGNHLVQIMESIIDITRVETGDMKIRKTSCRLNALLLDLYDRFGKSIRESGKESVELHLKRGSKDPQFSFTSEPYRLSKILSILLENALKYTEKGIIEFGYAIHQGSGESEKDEILFFVKDTGRGIPAEKMPYLFDRFRVTPDQHLKLSDGAGLGLPLTKAYVKVLGGRIWCTSQPEKGSEFYFTLPYEIEQGSQEEREIPVSGQPLDIQKHLKILVAEDEEGNYLLLKAMLKELGATLLWARNGKDAVSAFRRQKDIDLILMDLRMPVMSGYEAVEKIRELNGQVPIIVQTAFAREEERDSILRMGCNSFLIKPISREALYREIGKLATAGNR